MTEASAQCMAATLQPGTSLVASGYCLYSSSTFFCLTLGAGVQVRLPLPHLCPVTPVTPSMNCLTPSPLPLTCAASPLSRLFCLTLGAGVQAPRCDP